MSSNKINDLLEDLQDTLDNSILNKSGGSKTETENESETVSELFKTLNKNAKDDFDDDDTELKISKAIPTPSVFDEALKNQKNFKPKSASLSDTKGAVFGEVKTEKSKRSPLESFLTNSETGEDGEFDGFSEEHSSINKINVERARESDYGNGMDDIEETEEIDIEDDASDMDMDLINAIGIGKKPGSPGEDSESAGTFTGFAGNTQDGRDDFDDRPAPRKKPVKSFYNKIINKEYVNREQVNEIFSSYQKAYISEFVKLFLGGFLFLILFYMEIAPYLNWKMPNVMNINFYNLPYIWIDLQILVLVAALNSKSLIHGLKAMFSGGINVYSIAFFFFSLSFIHTMLTLYLRYNNPDIVLYNAISAYCLVLVSLYNLLDMNSEITSFKTVSAKKPKYALSLSLSGVSQSPQPYRSSHLESDLFKDIIPHDAAVGGVLKTPFISSFFSRTYKDKNAGGLIKYFIYISLFGALALFIFLIGFAGDSGDAKDWYGSLTAVTALLFGSVPLCSFIVEAYPVYKAQKKARASGSAFVGGKSLGESADTAILSLYDKDIFPAQHVKIFGIKVYGNNRLETAMQNLCIVFDKLNMPPADTFKASTNFDRHFNKNINFISIDDYGICYLSNNKKLFLGTPEYISNIGLTPSYDQNFDDPFVKSSGSIMFLASENEIIAKVYLKYEITADFHEIIKNIKKLNACLCIRTFDPNIDDILLSKLGNIKKYPIRVLKLKDFNDAHTTPERMDSPLVSKDSVKSLVNALLIAGKTKTVIKSNVFIQTFAFTISIALALVLGFLGQLGGINSGHLFLLQSFWMLPVIVLLGISSK